MNDYISRQAVWELISKLQNFYEEERKVADDYGSEIMYVGSIDALTAMEDGLSDIPSADVRPVVYGEWEPGDPVCPVCGEDKFKGLDADIWADWQPLFCPNCGCYMEGKVNG